MASSPTTSHLPPLLLLLLMLLLHSLPPPASAAPEKPACAHSIYCNNTILRAIHAHRLYSDMKDFVDRPLNKEPFLVNEAFDLLFADTGATTTAALYHWVEDNFLPAGSDIFPVILTDWQQKPRFIEQIPVPEIKEWALGMNNMIYNLARAVNQDVSAQPSRHSLLPATYPFIASGPTYRESYYWDAYWINHALLVSQMQSTAKGIILNYLDQIEAYQYPPTGLRVYYEERTGPPLMTEMVRQFLKRYDDQELLERALPLLESEYEWWMLYRSVRLAPNGAVLRLDDNSTPNSHVLNLYRAYSNVPRPEAFVSDIALMKKAFDLSADDALQPHRIYRDLASASESGWELSSRWCSEERQITSIHTFDIVPVDLNSILYKNERTMAEWYAKFEQKELARQPPNTARAREYQVKAAGKLAAANRRLVAMQHFLWDNSRALWLDFDTSIGSSKDYRNRFYISSLYPVWAGITSNIESVAELEQPLSRADMEGRLFETLQSIGLFDFKGGIPTSTSDDTGQLYDYPNTFAALELVAIDALAIMGETTPAAAKESRRLASRWLTAAYRHWKASGTMYESYSALSADADSLQPDNIGYGWSIGVAYNLIAKYCRKDSCIAIDTPGVEGDTNSILTIVLTVSLIGGALLVLTIVLVTGIVCIRRRIAKSQHPSTIDIPLEPRATTEADSELLSDVA